MRLAIEQAQKSLQEGGIPIGSVLVRNNEVIAKGHNKRVQEKNPILHAEMDCLNNAGRIGNYRDTVLYSTLFPCYMCGGTIVQFKIPKVVVGESVNFPGSADLLRSKGVAVLDLELKECIDMMKTFIANKPDLWNEDIGD